MKKTILIIGILAFLGFNPLNAQNVQLHYDFGRSIYPSDHSERPMLTTTIEMFKSDRWGSSFFLVDMDYTSEGVAAAYWEIARELKFWKGPLSAHIEYNGGLNYIKNAYLVGTTYSYNNSIFTRGFAVSVMYKYIQKLKSPNNFQLTSVWYLHFAKRKCTFIGFADWWREPGPYGDFVFLAKPQFWLNFNKFKGVDETFNLSVGSELELSNNFARHDGFYGVPTVAVKWSF